MYTQALIWYENIQLIGNFYNNIYMYCIYTETQISVKISILYSLLAIKRFTLFSFGCVLKKFQIQNISNR